MCLQGFLETIIHEAFKRLKYSPNVSPAWDYWKSFNLCRQNHCEGLVGGTKRRSWSSLVRSTFICPHRECPSRAPLTEMEVSRRPLLCVAETGLNQNDGFPADPCSPALAYCRTQDDGHIGKDRAASCNQTMLSHTPIISGKYRAVMRENAAEGPGLP